MARRRRRSANRPKPRPSSGPALRRPWLTPNMRKLAREWPARCKAILESPEMKERLARLRQNVADAQVLWQSLAGCPMPTSYGEAQIQAVRFGIPAERAISGNYTLRDLHHFMIARHLKALDNETDRRRAAAAEAEVRRGGGGSIAGGAAPTPTVPLLAPPPPRTAEAVGGPKTTEDEKLAGIVRRLTDNACRVLTYLLTENATSYRNPRPRQRIADELVLSIDDVKAVRRELKKAGVPIDSEPGAKGGWWLTPDGVRVAEIVARQAQPAVTGKPDGSNKPGVNRG